MDQLSKKSFLNIELQTRSIAPLVSIASPRRALSLLRRLGYAFAPSLIRSRFYQDHGPHPLQLHATSWMDGLRGLSACVICSCHVLTAFYDLSFAGLQEVLLIFFVVGGYCSSKRALEQMNNTDLVSRGKLLHGLSGSTFRRWFRLFLPVFAGTFITAMLAYAGAFDYVRPYTESPLREQFFRKDWNSHLLKKFPTFSEQLWYWLSDMGNTINIWPVKPYAPNHNPFLWTIREEFRCSIHLYIALLASVRMRPYVRLAFLVILSQYHIFCERWEIMIYLWGASIAQLEILIKQQAHRSKPTELLPSSISAPPPYANSATSGKDVHLAAISLPDQHPTSPETSHKHYATLQPLTYNLIWLLSFVFALSLMTYPLDGNTPGPEHPYFRFLNRLVPAFWPRPERIICGGGVVIFTICMLQASPSSLAHRTMTNNFAQYLGRNFFGMILVQINILSAGVYMVPQLVWNVIGGSTPTQHCFGLLTGVLASITLSLWGADVFTREVDSRCVMLVKWIESACFLPENKENRNEGAKRTGAQASPTTEINTT